MIIIPTPTMVQQSYGAIKWHHEYVLKLDLHTAFARAGVAQVL
jgi:hypothetical protein